MIERFTEWWLDEVLMSDTIFAVFTCFTVVIFLIMVVAACVAVVWKVAGVMAL